MMHNHYSTFWSGLSMTRDPCILLFTHLKPFGKSGTGVEHWPLIHDKDAWKLNLMSHQTASAHWCDLHVYILSCGLVKGFCFAVLPQWNKLSARYAMYYTDFCLCTFSLSLSYSFVRHLQWINKNIWNGLIFNVWLWHLLPYPLRKLFKFVLSKFTRPHWIWWTRDGVM